MKNLTKLYIIHLAARSSPEDYINFSVETEILNSLGTFNMSEIVKKNVEVFLYK